MVARKKTGFRQGEGEGREKEVPEIYPHPHLIVRGKLQTQLYKEENLFIPLSPLHRLLSGKFQC